MLNIVLLCTLWVCIWTLITKEKELKAANDKVDELEDVIIDLNEDKSRLEDEVWDLQEQGGAFNE